MPEVPTTYTLERLYQRVAELEADLRVINSNIEYLEHIVLGKRPSNPPRQERDNWKEISEHVKEELFNYAINHPEEHNQ
jgi:hypothetical protein